MARLSGWVYGLFFVLATVSALAQSTFSASDKNLSFTVPAGWKAEDNGGKVAITGADGAKYVLIRDGLPSVPNGEAANNAALKDAAQKLAQPLLSGIGYAGVRPITVDAGSGAMYRFRGRGTQSDNDLAEVWVASVGSHTVALIPASAPQPDHLYELSSLFKSIAFADSPSAGRGGGNRRNAQPAKPPQSPGGSLAGGSTAGSSSAGGSAAGSSPTRPQQNGNVTRAAQRNLNQGKTAEEYTGHLMEGDVSFSMKLFDDQTATADWASTPEKSSHFTGTYTGTDGNYVVKLTRSTGDNQLSAKGLTLVTRGLGGMETGTFTTDASTAKRNIAELKLSSVEGDSAGKGKMGANRRMQQRRNQMNRGRRGAANNKAMMRRMARLARQMQKRRF